MNLREVRYQKRWEQSHVRFKRRMKKKFKEGGDNYKFSNPNIMFNWKERR